MENQCNDLILAYNKKCGTCCKRIKNNFPANFCNGCSDFFHIKCSKIDRKDNTSRNSWLCSKCTLACLPFSSVDNNSMLLTLKGINSEGFSDNIPSFTVQSLLDKLPGQTFSTDEFLSDSISSKYFTPGEFVTTSFSNKQFSIFHLNIASLQLHIDELRSFLSNLKHRFKIICISETRLHDVKPLVNVDIDGYTFEHTPTSSQCGGTGIYISNEFEYDLLEKLSVSHPNISESTFIEIKNKSKKNICCWFYISPSF